MPKILIIDDEEIIRRRLSGLLVLDGYEVFTAEHGLAGLEIFKKENPEIILCDIKMPGMDGIEVLTQIKEISFDSDVFMITGHGGTESAIQALQAGAFDYLTKPISYDQLEIGIRRALEKQEMQRKLATHVQDLEAAVHEKDKQLSLRKQVEDQLRVSQERYEMSTKAATVGIWEWNLMENKLYIDPVIKECLGYTNTEFLDDMKSWMSYVYKDDRDIVMKNIQDCGKSRQRDFVVDYRMMHKDGSIRWMLMRGSAKQDNDGNVVKMIGTNIDITDRKNEEEEVRMARDAADAANSSKGAFLAMMSHEIRTPMNGIIGMTELLEDTGLTDDQREYFDMIKFSSATLLALINDILDFSKIEAGKLDLEPIAFSLRDSLGNTLKSLTFKVKEKGLTMPYNVMLDVPDDLVGDPARLRQIILNLTSNSLKFTDEGQVSLNVAIESMTEDEVVLHFEVSDTGIGIPEDKQELIFQSFTQADSSTSRKFGGTGLGLSISLQLVKMMNGKIWVESEVGKGSTFHFTVQFGLQKVASSSVEPVDLNDLPVLAVDDNVINRRIFKDVLINWGMKPTVVDSGKLALEALERTGQNVAGFALVLLDINMPGMDGFSVAEQINARHEEIKPPIIVLSSSGQRGDAARCKELGISAYLLKPAKQSELLKAIQTTLGHKTLDDNQSPALITRHSLREQKKSLNILLAEDNRVNQMFAVRILEKSGHKVTVAINGQEAVDVFEKQSFDIILMDVQMPLMNGFEATAAIRGKEEESGTHIPIIALTAHAIKGYNKKCLDAGMDGYVTKPIEKEILFDVIEKLTLGLETKKSVPPGDTPDAELTLSIMDKSVAMERVDNDMELLKEVAGLFLDDCPGLLTKIRKAIEEGNSEALHCEAHAMKGALGILSANQAFEIAFKLEKIGKSGEFSEAEEAFRDLENAIEKLIPVLKELVK